MSSITFEQVLAKLAQGVKVKFVVQPPDHNAAPVSMTFHRCGALTPGTEVINMTKNYHFLCHDEWPYKLEQRGIYECQCNRA